MTDPVETWTVAIDADTTPIKAELQKTTQLGRQFGQALGTAFDGLALRGQGLGDVLRTLGLSLSRMAFASAFKPLEQSLGGLLTNLMSGGLGAGGGVTLSQSTPIPFAKGGVIASPVTFPLGTGTGLAGERGAEAIMPLSRGPDGRLGVSAAAASAPNVTFNIATPDAESFRRSETQIAAMLARVVSRGQRNL